METGSDREREGMGILAGLSMQTTSHTRLNTKMERRECYFDFSKQERSNKRRYKPVKTLPTLPLRIIRVPGVAFMSGLIECGI